jgi:hypothetical protein
MKAVPTGDLAVRPPNLFDFATSELSQDAFVCWLASWADASCRELDGPLHTAAAAFLDRLLEVGGGPKVAGRRSVEVRRQWNGIDVLLVVNGDAAIIIEDKTDTKDHSDQLRRYRGAVAGEFPEGRIAAVYLKTGDQCDYGGAERAGYGCFLRRDFLGVLQRGVAAGVTHDVFADFLRHLQGIEEAVQSFPVVPPAEWTRRQWIGFFMSLQATLGDGEWENRGHGGGGSLTFRWHRRDDKFLRLLGGGLDFRLEVTDEAHQASKWVEWNRALLARNGTGGINVLTPRRKLGKRMTVAVLDGDYREVDGRGLLDLARTVETLRKAGALMDAALA